MNKLTFREFLMEVDVGDLDWAKSVSNDKRNRRMINDNGNDALAPKKKKQKVRPRRIIQDTRTSL